MLLTSDFYIIQKETLKPIDKILLIDNGMGLYFEDPKYSIYDNVFLLELYVEEELLILGHLLGININTLSIHRTSIKDIRKRI